MGIAYELQFVADGQPVPEFEERAKRLLALKGQRFRVTLDDWRFQHRFEPQSRRRGQGGKKRDLLLLDSPCHDYVLYLNDGQEEIGTAMTLDNPTLFNPRYREPGFFSELSFAGIKHQVYQRDFDSRFGPAFAEFMWSVSQAFNASRSYLHDDLSLYWRLNAHSIYYHPAKLYQQDVERVRQEWLNGIPWQWVAADTIRTHRLWTFEDRENWEARMDDWVARAQTVDLQRRLKEVDYRLDVEADALQLLGFPGPVKGYVDSFFLL